MPVGADPGGAAALGSGSAPPVAGYDALNIGSAVYAGRWLKAARESVGANAGALSEAHVWLFSSGPLDDPTAEALTGPAVERLTAATGSLGHHVFAGRLDRSGLNRPERALTKLVHAPDGDFRDWDDVSAWADEIADALVPLAS